MFLLALWLRWPYPEPTWTHIDERTFISVPLGFWRGDLNPRFFNYSTFQFYLASALYFCYYSLFSSETFEQFIAYHYLLDNTHLLFLARSLMTLMSAATVVAVFFLGRQLYGATAGLIAGAVLAVMPLHVRFSHLAANDIPMTLWLTLALLASVRNAQYQHRGDYLWAGLFIGLASACKYPGALVAVAAIAATSCHHLPWKDRNLWLSGLVSLFVFASTSPYVLLDFSAFFSHFSYMGDIHLAEANRHDMRSFSELLRFGLGHIAVLSIVAALTWKPRRFTHAEIPLLTTLVAFAALTLGGSAFMRYALPLAPLLAVLMASFATRLPSPLWLALWLLPLLAESGWSSDHTRRLLSGPDTREQAVAWLHGEYPHGARVAHIPGGKALQLPFLDQNSLSIRSAAFARSFGDGRLIDALLALSERAQLPAFYFSWDRQALKRPLPPNATNQLATLIYHHPIIDERAPQAPDGFSIVTAFIPDDFKSSVYDRPDWFYVPIGHASASHSRARRFKQVILPLPCMRRFPRLLCI